MSPEDLMATVDVDLRAREFWIGGFAAMEKLVAEFESLWAQYNVLEQGAAERSL